MKKLKKGSDKKKLLELLLNRNHIIQHLLKPQMFLHENSSNLLQLFTRFFILLFTIMYLLLSNQTSTAQAQSNQQSELVNIAEDELSKTMDRAGDEELHLSPSLLLSHSPHDSHFPDMTSTPRPHTTSQSRQSNGTQEVGRGQPIRIADMNNQASRGVPSPPPNELDHQYISVVNNQSNMVFNDPLEESKRSTQDPELQSNNKTESSRFRWNLYNGNEEHNLNNSMSSSITARNTTNSPNVEEKTVNVDRAENSRLFPVTRQAEETYGAQKQVDSIWVSKEQQENGKSLVDRATNNEPQQFNNNRTTIPSVGMISYSAVTTTRPPVINSPVTSLKDSLRLLTLKSQPKLLLLNSLNEVYNKSSTGQSTAHVEKVNDGARYTTGQLYRSPVFSFTLQPETEKKTLQRLTSEREKFLTHHKSLIPRISLSRILAPPLSAHPNSISQPASMSTDQIVSFLDANPEIPQFHNHVRDLESTFRDGRPSIIKRAQQQQLNKRPTKIVLAPASMDEFLVSSSSQANNEFETTLRQQPNIQQEPGIVQTELNEPSVISFEHQAVNFQPKGESFSTSSSQIAAAREGENPLSIEDTEESDLTDGESGESIEENQSNGKSSPSPIVSNSNHVQQSKSHKKNPQPHAEFLSMSREPNILNSRHNHQPMTRGTSIVAESLSKWPSNSDPSLNGKEQRQRQQQEHETERELLVGPFKSESEAPATITLSGVVYQKSGSSSSIVKSPIQGTRERLISSSVNRPAHISSHLKLESNPEAALELSLHGLHGLNQKDFMVALQNSNILNPIRNQLDESPSSNRPSQSLDLDNELLSYWTSASGAGNLAYQPSSSSLNLADFFSSPSPSSSKGSSTSTQPNLSDILLNSLKTTHISPEISMADQLLAHQQLNLLKDQTNTRDPTTSQMSQPPAHSAFSSVSSSNEMTSSPSDNSFGPFSLDGSSFGQLNDEQLEALDFENQSKKLALEAAMKESLTPVFKQIKNPAKHQQPTSSSGSLLPTKWAESSGKKGGLATSIEQFYQLGNSAQSTNAVVQQQQQQQQIVLPSESNQQLNSAASMTHAAHGKKGPIVIVQKDVKPVKYHLLRAYLKLRRLLRPFEATYVFPHEPYGGIPMLEGRSQQPLAHRTSPGSSNRDIRLNSQKPLASLGAPMTLTSSSTNQQQQQHHHHTPRRQQHLQSNQLVRFLN